MGDKSTGKSSICDRFISQSFNEKYEPTVGIDYKNKIIEQKDSLVNINCWDISGDDAFLDIRNEFYKDSFAVFLVFDLQYKRTFDNIVGWAKEAMDCGAKEGSLFLIGNKSEEKSSRGVKENEARQVASKIGGKYYEVSAKTDSNISLLFNDLMKSLD